MNSQTRQSSRVEGQAAPEGNSTPPNPVNLGVVAKSVLWAARLLTVMVLGFWGFFLIAHLVGDAGASPRPLTARDIASLGLMIASVFGLGLALKWERNGALLVIVAVVAGAVLNWRVLLFPATLIPSSAALFLIGSHLRTSKTPEA